jgi:hypothetical protein
MLASNSAADSVLLSGRKMLSQSIWIVSIVLEIVLLGRGLVARLAFRYPIFYAYITYVVLKDLVRFIAYRTTFGIYFYTYWSTEFLSLLIGCIVVFEIYRIGLAPYPGTSRLARQALFFIFCLALVEAITSIAVSSQFSLAPMVLKLELALRTVQALSIIVLAALLLVYSIPFGRNLQGILLGYGFFVGQRVICLTFYGGRQWDFWFYAYSASYDVALGIWLAHLWSYSPAPQPNAIIHLDRDYQKIAAATRERLLGMRGYLGKAVGS